MTCLLSLVTTPCLVQWGGCAWTNGTAKPAASTSASMAPFTRRNLQAGFGERPPAPGERAAVPPVEPCDRDAIAGRLDQPVVAEIDRGVIHLRRLGLAAVAEVHDVARLEILRVDAPVTRHLTAHLHRRAPAQHAR